MTQNNDEDGDQNFQVHGVVVPVPNALVNEIRREYDREHMQFDAAKMSLFSFLDGLDKDQLMALRSILNMGNNGIQYTDGMVSAQLRLIHRVDPDSGKELLA